MGDSLQSPKKPKSSHKNQRVYRLFLKGMSKNSEGANKFQSFIFYVHEMEMEWIDAAH